MTADEVTKTLDAAIEETGVSPDRFVRMPRLLSDNGPCCISKELKAYLKGREQPHSRGRPFHP